MSKSFCEIQFLRSVFIILGLGSSSMQGGGLCLPAAVPNWVISRAAQAHRDQQRHNFLKHAMNDDKGSSMNYVFTFGGLGRPICNIVIL